MGSGSTDRRQYVEQQLFDVHLRLERARTELGDAEEQVLAATEAADGAHERMTLSETALAHYKWCAARARREQLLARAIDARALVERLEGAQDDLLDRLIG